MRVLVGFTERGLNGYEAGMEQNVWEFSVPEAYADASLEAVAESFFVASNAPIRYFDENDTIVDSPAKKGTLDRFFQDYLYGPAAGQWRSLSVGDTVSFAHIDDAGAYVIQEKVACDRFGWKVL